MKYLIFASLFVFASALHYKDCGSVNGRVLSVSVSKCEGAVTPCPLKRNTTDVIGINFTSNVDTTKVKTIVHGIIPGGFVHVLLKLIHKEQEGVRFLGVKEDACTNNNVDHCNIKSGESIQYTNTLFVDPIYPLLRLTVRWELKDDQDKDLVCIEIPVEILK